MRESDVVQHHGQSLTAVADLELLVFRDFRERTAQGRIEEKRVVPEAVFSAPLRNDFAFHLGAEGLQQPPRFRQRDHAHETCRTIGDALHFPQYAIVVGFVVAGIAG